MGQDTRECRRSTLPTAKPLPAFAEQGFDSATELREQGTYKESQKFESPSVVNHTDFTALGVDESYYHAGAIPLPLCARVLR
jgi:hypothetical protein